MIYNRKKSKAVFSIAVFLVSDMFLQNIERSTEASQYYTFDLKYL